MPASPPPGSAPPAVDRAGLPAAHTELLVGAARDLPERSRSVLVRGGHRALGRVVRDAVLLSPTGHPDHGVPVAPVVDPISPLVDAAASALDEARRAAEPLRHLPGRRQRRLPTGFGVHGERSGVGEGRDRSSVGRLRLGRLHHDGASALRTAGAAGSGARRRDPGAPPRRGPHPEPSLGDRLGAGSALGGTGRRGDARARRAVARRGSGSADRRPVLRAQRELRGARLGSGPAGAGQDPGAPGSHAGGGSGDAGSGRAHRCARTHRDPGLPSAGPVRPVRRGSHAPLVPSACGPHRRPPHRSCRRAHGLARRGRRRADPARPGRGRSLRTRSASASRTGTHPGIPGGGGAG